VTFKALEIKPHQPLYLLQHCDNAIRLYPSTKKKTETLITLNSDFKALKSKNKISTLTAVLLDIFLTPVRQCHIQLYSSMERKPQTLITLNSNHITMLTD